MSLLDSCVEDVLVVVFFVFFSLGIDSGLVFDITRRHFPSQELVMMQDGEKTA